MSTEEIIKGSDYSITGLGLLRHYELYLVSLVSIKMVADSLSGKIDEEKLPEIFLANLKNELSTNHIWNSLNYDNRIQSSFIYNRAKLLAEEVDFKINREEYISTSSNKTITFIREYGSSAVNSIRPLADTVIAEEDEEPVHYIKIQVKNDGAIWLFDMKGDNISYNDVDVIVIGIPPALENTESSTALTSFFKFLSVYMARDMVSEKRKREQEKLKSL